MSANPTIESPSAVPMPYRRTVFFGLVIGAHLVGYDNTMVSVAVPRMQGSLSATLDETAWVLAAYLIAVAIAMPLVGLLADRFGRKKVFLFTLAGYAVATIFAGAANTLFQLVAYRFVQGIFASPFQPLSQSFVFDAYTPEERGMAIGWWTIGLMSGMLSGPLLGGYITEYYSWRMAFYLSIPASIFAFAIIFFFMRTPHHREAHRRFNFGGYLILVIALVALQVVLSRGGRVDWFAATEIVIALGISLIALYFFIVHTVTSPHPFIELVIFRDRNFMISCALFFVMGAHWLGYLALASPFLQTLAGYPVVTAGTVFGTLAVANATAAISAGRLVQYISPSVVSATGLSLMAYSTWYFSSLTPDVSQLEAAFTFMVAGFGYGFFFVPLTIIAFSTMPKRHTNVAAGFFALARNFGSSIGASVVVAYLVYYTQANHAWLSESVSRFSESVRHVPLPEAWSLTDVSSLAALNVEVTRQAALVAYIDDLRWLAMFAAFFLPLYLFVRLPGRATQSTMEPAE